MKVHDITAVTSHINVITGNAFHLKKIVTPPNAAGTSPLTLTRVVKTPDDQGSVIKALKYWAGTATSGHCISKINGRYFDPSYGIGSFKNEIDYENAAVGALEHTYTPIFMGVRIGHPSSRLKRQSTGSADLQFIP